MWAVLLNLELEYKHRVRELYKKEGISWMHTMEGKRLLINIAAIEAIKALKKRYAH
jgi:3-methyladenine DNA glycosylase Mpg